MERGKIDFVMNIMDLSDKRILVTGAGSGIGQETCKVLSSLGAEVLLLDISEEGMNETVELMGKAGAKTIVADLSDVDSVAACIKELDCLPLDGMVHCAGVSSRKPLNALKKEGFDKLMSINFYSFVELTKILAKRGNFADGGSIVVMSSISSIKGYKAKTEYCVSKAAVDAFVRCVALELAPRRIRVNSVMAAEVLTPLALKARELGQSVGAPEFTAPLGPSKPYEVANVIAFLLSDATKTITGTSVLIDGGATI